MVTKCPNCGDTELEVMKCLRCGGVDFIEQQFNRIQAEGLASCEYVCLSCGSTLEVPEPSNYPTYQKPSVDAYAAYP